MGNLKVLLNEKDELHCRPLLQTTPWHSEDDYDADNDVYKGEMKLLPSPVALPTVDLNADGTIDLPFGTLVDVKFGDEVTIRAKVLYLRGKKRLIELGIQAGDILYELNVKPSKHINLQEETVPDFAKTLTIVQVEEENT